MKLALMLLLAVAAFGQSALKDCADTRSSTAPCINYGPETRAVSLSKAPQFTRIIIENSKDNCDKPVTFGKTTKKIADLFPEECGVPSTGRLIVPEPAAQIDGTHFVSPPDINSTNPHFLQGASGGTMYPPEPVDVPAIQESYIAHHKGEAWGCGLDACLATEDEYKSRPACADKTRILMHDEQNPPKYWCYAPRH